MSQRALCVSLHDVSPQTWSDCCTVLHAIRQVSDIPLGLLVVPYRHHRPVQEAGPFIDALEALRAAGHELVLHGYTHWDDGPEPHGALERWRRRVLTRSEGEFAALDVDDARAALQAGLAFFAAHGWPVEGFVAPAWMMSAPALQALAGSGLGYAGMFGGLLSLPEGRWHPSLALVYSSRHPVGDSLTRCAVDVAAFAQSQRPLLRIALHPADARRPQNLRHAQQLIETALRTRIPLTEGDYLRRVVAGN